MFQLGSTLRHLFLFDRRFHFLLHFEGKLCGRWLGGLVRFFGGGNSGFLNLCLKHFRIRRGNIIRVRHQLFKICFFRRHGIICD